jgi:hypothetical protein
MIDLPVNGELPTSIAYTNAVFNPLIEEQNEPDTVDTRVLRPGAFEDASEA